MMSNYLFRRLESTDKKLLFYTVSGSRAYGLSTPDSDTGARFVYSNPLSYYLGFDSSHKDSMPIDGNDVFGYEIRKFIQLCVNSNPSTLEILFSDRSDILYVDKVFNHNILCRKHDFLSRKVFTTYVSYAKGQIEKAKGYTRQAVERLLYLENLLLLNGIDYKSDLGGKRKTNVLNYGYDTKNIAHAVRLIIACKNILLEPELYSPKITDQSTIQLLLDINNGKYTIDAVQDIFQYYLLEAEEAYKMCNLPEEVSLRMFSDSVKEIVLRNAI